MLLVSRPLGASYKVKSKVNAELSTDTHVIYVFCYTICILIHKSILLTLAERCALASRRASVYSDPIINSCDLYANSGHFFRRGNGGSFVGPAGQPVEDRERDR